MDSERGVLHVLTVHFNTPDLTSRLVSTFPPCTPSGREIWIHILDNGSTPDNYQALSAAVTGLDRVNLLASDQNMGFGEGMNSLARMSSIEDRDLLWLLNPDTELLPGCLAGLESEIDLGTYDIVSPLICCGDASSRWIWYCGGSISLPQLRLKHDLYGEPLHTAPRTSFATRFVTGAAPMMRYSTFNDVGGFESGYFLYWEDMLFSWRANERGFRLGVVPMAHLWHAVGASSGYSQSRTFYYWSARNRFVFAKDIGISRWRLLWGLGGTESLRLVAKALLERKERFEKAIAVMRGSLAGLRYNRSQIN